VFVYFNEHDYGPENERGLLGDEDQGTQPMKRVAGLACWLAGVSASGLLPAAVTNVRVIGTTATQALIGYTAPDAAACSIAVSQTADGSGNPLPPLAHDVDPAIFANSNLASRLGSIPVGQSRVVAIGKRDAETGGDGRYYSRASTDIHVLLWQDHLRQQRCGVHVSNVQYSAGDRLFRPVADRPGQPGKLGSAVGRRATRSTSSSWNPKPEYGCNTSLIPGLAIRHTPTIY
jgi:hypothetical protein